MKYTLIILLIFLVNEAFSQKLSTLDEATQFSISLLLLHELNPIELQESQKINEMLKNSAKRYLENEIEVIEEREKIFSILYENGRSEYDDSVDERRMRIRRAICFIALAFQSDSSRRDIFVELAKFSLSSCDQFSEDKLLTEEKLGIQLVELLFKFENNQLQKQDITLVEEFLRGNSTALASEVKNRTASYLEYFVNNLGRY
jgi:hypothetical protein